MIKETEVNEGEISAMRVALKIARRLAVFLDISAVLFAIAIMALNREAFIGIPVAMLTAGNALFGIALGSKAIQAKTEGVKPE